MNSLEKAKYRPRPCPQCGSPVRVSWLKDEREATGVDWVPHRPRCTRVACPLSNPSEWSLTDFVP